MIQIYTSVTQVRVKFKLIRIINKLKSNNYGFDFVPKFPA